MFNSAINIDDCQGEIIIRSLNVSGFGAGLKASNTSGLSIGKGNIDSCNTGIILENCWNSDIKNLNITNLNTINQFDKFRYTNLFLSIMLANSVH